MEARTNLLRGPADWNRKPEAGYLNPQGREVQQGQLQGKAYQTGATGPNPISNPRGKDEVARQLSRQDSDATAPKVSFKMTGKDKQPSPEQIRPMTPLSMSLNVSGLQKSSLTQQIPSLSLRSYYRDSKLFEVMQAGIMQVGMNR